jgi:hypothetical protein
MLRIFWSVWVENVRPERFGGTMMPPAPWYADQWLGGLKYVPESTVRKSQAYIRLCQTIGII